MAAMPRLFTFWRSSASYRVRIALNIKNLTREDVPIHFRKEGGQHRHPDFLSMNPQGLLPVWQESEWSLNQSLAIIEYLEECHPTPSLLPKEPKQRAEVRAVSLSIACDIHPLNNLRVLEYLRGPLHMDEKAVGEWVHHWIHQGFESLERTLERTAGSYCFGDTVTMADVCLVPQVYNAARFQSDTARFPVIQKLTETLCALEEFHAAAPEQQPDAES